jgi:uncharacterized DUF497 family protein
VYAKYASFFAEPTLVKNILWSQEKNSRLLEQRGISFEDVLLAVRENRLLAIEVHPRQATYPHQKILVVDLNGYVHIVPFVETDSVVFLKTIFPDRKFHKKYAHLLKKEGKS